jgi:3,4-dihydroxy 2-butanone 4-phosphate synthase/GTP cyclohydrolase II
MGEAILTRINSTQVTNDILGSLTDTLNKKLEDIFKKFESYDKCAILFINQEMQSVELLDRLAELKRLQAAGDFTTPRIAIDTKDFGIGAQILHDLDITKIKLLTNSYQNKRVGMIGYGLEITEYLNY